MASELDTQKSRAAQAGVLMRAYRESFVPSRGRRGISQEELLRRMADVDPEYGQRFSHTTVSRWESGVTLPRIGRLRTFGKALDLSEDEVAGIILLAGLAPDYEAALAQAVSGEENAPPDPAEESGHVPGAQAPSLFPARAGDARLLGEVSRFFIFRFLLPGALIAGFHYLLSAVGWNNGWMPVICVVFAVFVVLGQGFVLPDRSAGIREFYWISVFFVLTTPLLQFAPLGMDHYNFHLVSGIRGLDDALHAGVAAEPGLGLDGGADVPPVAPVEARRGQRCPGDHGRGGGVGHLSASGRCLRGGPGGHQLLGGSAVGGGLRGPAHGLLLILFFRESGVVLSDEDRRSLFQVLAAAACVSVRWGLR